MADLTPTKVMVPRTSPSWWNRFAQMMMPEQNWEEWNGWWQVERDGITAAATTPEGAISMYESIANTTPEDGGSEQ